jgi:hypothetical protein
MAYNSLVCVCGKQYTDERYLNRHRNTCKDVQQRSKRTWEGMAHVETDPELRAKLQQIEHAAMSSPRPFMGRSKRERKAEINAMVRISFFIVKGAKVNGIL